MQACVTYLRISAYSYPALAAYNAGAALYRSFGKTSTTMYLSILSNIINVIGNCIGVFALHAGVAGVEQSIWSVASLMGMSSMGPVFITVIGQCMGAGDIPQAEEIRHASDYDDFYIASKEESERQILTADEFINLAEKYCREQLEK